jgi:chromosome segregation ATPase
MVTAEDTLRIENKLDDLHQAIHGLVVNYQQMVMNQSLMQQELAALSKTLHKLEEVDKALLTCKGDCNGKANLLKKDIETAEDDIKDLQNKIRFRDKIIIGLTITVFLRMFLYFLIGVK